MNNHFDEMEQTLAFPQAQPSFLEEDRDRYVLREASDEEKELFVRYGSAASEAMLDYPCHFFHIPDCIGIIAYRIESHCAVVFGDPICPVEELERLIQAFQEYCEAAKLNMIYITVSDSFAKWMQDRCAIKIEVCQEFTFNPQVNPIFESHRLQHRVEKAVKHGLTFHEYAAHDKKIEQALLAIGKEWSKARKGPSLHLGHLNFFEDRLGKRWFYVKDGEQITALAMLSRLDAQQGWLLKFFMSMPGVFHETSEFLMISLLTRLKQEGCQFLTKGMAPVDSLGSMEGLGLYAKAAKWTYQIISSIFKFKKRKEYWYRYHPHTSPSYVMLSQPKMGWNEMTALFKVFKINC
jgi:lysylphosphatidylglycerol synthetase-like protein (DUF2156 family)